MSTQQLTREEIARVFFMHYGCEYRFEDLSHIYKIGECNTFKLAWEQDFNNCKPLLTPVDRISEEHLHEIAIMYGGKFCHLRDNFLQVVGEDNMTIKYFILTSDELPSHLVDMLRAWGYETKLFFAPNHPCNGLTAIQLGLAIDNLQTK